MGGSGHVPVGNLPFRLTSFIGREAELVELVRLSATSRLLTLTGTGGVGKTRLAIELASRVAARHRAGTWFADLGAVSEASLVPQTVAGVLGISERAERPVIETICGSTRESDMLLVLDNCEHVLAACVRLVESLLATSPDLHIIATSRESLEVPGEVIWTVTPLTLPDLAWTHPRSILRSPAVQLFVTRAALGRPGFELDASNAATIAGICRRVDGIPLALELSAARVRIMPPDEILFRLEHRFELLEAGTHVAPPRQRTVRATLDWSYELLDDAERALFRRLSVFGGGFGIDAVAAVCRGGPVPAMPLGLLARLVDKSLVSTAPALGGRARYRLLETVREYAGERLRENSEWESVRGLHALHFMSLADVAASRLDSPEQLAWVDLLHADHDNLSTALEWAQLAEPSLLPRLAASLSDFWQVRGHYSEARVWLTAALDVERDATPLRARLLEGAGVIAWRRGDFEEARRSLEETVAIERHGGDRLRLGNALGNLGFVLFGSDDFSAADSLFEEELGIAQETGNRLSLAGALNHSGILALHLDQLAAACNFYTQAITLFDQLEHSNGAAYARTMLALALAQQDDLAGARRAVNEAIVLQARIGDVAGLAGAISAAAEVAARERRPERAMVLVGAADTRFATTSAHLPSLHRASRDRWLAAAQRQLGGRARPLLDKGARLTDEQTIAFVMSDEDRPRSGRDVGIIEALSEREQEVAQLIATGLTNRQIAANLRIAVRTVDAHSEHIRNKLGVRSRASIVAWVAEQHARAGPKIVNQATIRLLE